MLKQYIAIFLLCIFNFILVGHSIIPHEHDEVDHHAHTHDHHHLPASHHDKHHDEKDKKQSKGLSDFFSSVIHVSEFVNNENRNKVSEQTIQKGESEISDFSFISKTLPQNSDLKSKGIHYQDPDYFPPPNSHQGLRAPPVFFS